MAAAAAARISARPPAPTHLHLSNSVSAAPAAPAAPAAHASPLQVNPCKKKALTNMRAASKDATVVLNAPVDVTLEFALEYVEEDELVSALSFGF